MLYNYSKCGEFRPLVPNQLKYNHLSLDFFLFIKGASLQEVDVKIEEMSRFDTVWEPAGCGFSVCPACGRPGFTLPVLSLFVYL